MDGASESWGEVVFSVAVTRALDLERRWRCRLVNANADADANVGLSAVELAIDGE